MMPANAVAKISPVRLDACGRCPSTLYTASIFRLSNTICLVPHTINRPLSSPTSPVHMPQPRSRESFFCRIKQVKIPSILCLKLNNGCSDVNNVQEVIPVRPSSLEGCAGCGTPQQPTLPNVWLR